MFLLRASILLRSLTHSKFHIKSRSISQISVRDAPACAGTRSPPVSPPQLTDARRIRQCVDECTARIELGLHYRIPYPRPVSAPRASAAGPRRAPTGGRGRGPPPPSGTPAGADIAFRCFMQTSVFSRLRPTRLLLIKEQSSDVRGTRPDSAQTSRPAEGRRSRPAGSEPAEVPGPHSRPTRPAVWRRAGPAQQGRPPRGRLALTYALAVRQAPGPRRTVRRLFLLPPGHRGPRLFPGSHRVPARTCRSSAPVPRAQSVSASTRASPRLPRVLTSP